MSDEDRSAHVLQHDTARCGPLARWFGRVILWVTGWRNAGQIPEGRKFVVIAAPHTSNWDLVYMLAGAWTAGVRLSWVGKLSLFTGPLGWMLRAMGGVPIDRAGSRGVVGEIVEHFRSVERIALAIPPSGTRAFRDYWRSGFYHIAAGAQVPIICCYGDYSRKITGIGPAITPSGDLGADMDLIRAFYADKAGKFPERLSTIRLREEMEGGEGQEGGD